MIKPGFLHNDFRDCEDLELSNFEKCVFMTLYNLSLKSGWEYIAYVYENDTAIFQTDKIQNKVSVNNELIKEGVKLYHSHTSDSPISVVDLNQLYKEEVVSIGVVCKNKEIYKISIKDGYLPEMRELMEFTKNIKIDVYNTILQLETFGELTESEIIYMFYKERLFRVIREYGWTYEGGALDEQV